MSSWPGSTLIFGIFQFLLRISFEMNNGHWADVDAIGLFSSLGGIVLCALLNNESMTSLIEPW